MHMSKRLAAISLTVAGFLVGCAQAPTRTELSQIDYGSYPSDYKKSVERYLDMVLRDPGGKQIEWLREPRSMYNKEGPLLGGGISAGYAVCAYVNVRNNYGGYTGPKLSWFLIKNDNVIQSYMSATRDVFDTKQAERFCST